MNIRRARCGAFLTLLALPSMAFAANSARTDSLETVGAPPGFEGLAEPREVLVDVFYGGRKVGEALAVVRPGFVRFREPEKVANLIPSLAGPAALASSLSGDLPSHSDLACGESNGGECGALSFDLPGVIFDESKFRAEIFVSPEMLRVVPPDQDRFLPAPSARFSMTSSSGLAISGSSGRSPYYNFQNRTIIGFGSARARTDLSYASKLGLIVDDLVAEFDQSDRRYSAGLFWAPGLDLTGRRRIVGIGTASQFDTRADRENLSGTPVVVFLTQPARVDFVIDGRLVGSRTYDAGNHLLDTSGLPDGSYPLLLRITQPNGTSREERRFFVKNTQIAPAGHTIYFAYGGLLANSRRGHPVSLSKDLFYQAGTARRLNSRFAVDLSLIGTQKKAMAEVGAWVLTPFAQLRMAGLASTSGDGAALVQLGSTGRGRLNLSFDLRRVWSSDGQPLIPLPSFVDTFGSGPVGAQLGRGSYTQMSGSAGYRIGTAYVAVVGSLRKESHQRSDYSIGPTVTWPIVRRSGLQLTFEADAHRSRTSTDAYVGLRLLMNRGRLSLGGTAGTASLTSRDKSQDRVHRMTGSLSANYFNQSDDRTEYSVGGGVDRAIETTVAHGEATYYGRFGSARAEVLDDLEGSAGLQYGITLQSAVAVGGSTIGLGARDQDDGAVIVEVAGEADARFDVLVNGTLYGRLGSGGKLPIHLPPYRSYKVELKPGNAAAVDFDNGAQTVTLYPGTVEVLRWAARPFFTAFGQAVGTDGRPLANLLVQAPRSVGETDANGYFQVDVAKGDVLTFARAEGACHVRISDATVQKDFASLGRVICQ